MQFLIKTIVSAILIAAISIISKKLTFVGAILASLPITSILAMIWLYQDTKDATKIISLSTSIFWMVLPSLVFFIILPIFLKKNVNFYLSLFYSASIMAIVYYIYSLVLKFFGVKL